MAPPDLPVNPELVTALKRLKLGRILDTLPERLVLADMLSDSYTSPMDDSYIAPS